VFQGVVLTATSQLTSSSHPTSGKIWFPIVLFVFAAAAATVGGSLKFTSVEKTRYDDHRAEHVWPYIIVKIHALTIVAFPSSSTGSVSFVYLENYQF
jgi:hypothetical protein